MIFSRFGCEVKQIRCYEPETGKCFVLLNGRGCDRDEWFPYTIAGLRADGGIPEIEEKIREDSGLPKPSEDDLAR